MPSERCQGMRAALACLPNLPMAHPLLHTHLTTRYQAVPQKKKTNMYRAAIQEAVKRKGVCSTGTGRQGAGST